MSENREMSRLGELSEYEKRRIERIKRNEAMLAKLGLAPKRFTVMAVGKKAPLPRRVKRRVITGPTRRSLRLAGKPMPNYKEERIEEEKKSASSEKTSPPPLKRAKRATARQIAMAAQKRVEEVPKQCSRMSIKYLNVDVERLHSSWLGKIVPKLGGQVKRAVMELAVSKGSPKFSRMSGIQEWRNAVMLFVNVYVVFELEAREFQSYLSLHRTVRCQKYSNNNSLCLLQFTHSQYNNSNTNTKLALRARTQVQEQYLARECKGV